MPWGLGCRLLPPRFPGTEPHPPQPGNRPPAHSVRGHPGCTDWVPSARPLWLRTPPRAPAASFPAPSSTRPVPVCALRAVASAHQLPPGAFFPARLPGAVPGSCCPLGGGCCCFGHLPRRPSPQGPAPRASVCLGGLRWAVCLGPRVPPGPPAAFLWRVAGLCPRVHPLHFLPPPKRACVLAREADADQARRPPRPSPGRLPAPGVEDQHSVFPAWSTTKVATLCPP